jgi:hypothetical protein
MQMNIWDFQRILAQQVTSFLGLRQPRDASERLGGAQFSSALAYLLAEHLKTDPAWNSRQCWIDGLINTHITLLKKRSLRLNGRMVWGLTRDIGGAQWAEPFEAVLVITEDHILRYALWFADQRKQSRKVSRSGFLRDQPAISDNSSSQELIDIWHPLYPIGYLHQFAGEVQISPLFVAGHSI